MATPGEDSLFGRVEMSFGPANVYWDTLGDNIFLGGVDALTISKAVNKIELREAQAGDRPADRAVSSQVYQISMGLSRATVTRLEAIVQGVEIDRSGPDPKQMHLSDLVGQQDSSIVRQLTVFEIIDGIESTDEFHIWDFWKVAPMTESTELVYDATTQRYYGVVFETYKSDANVDHNLRPTYASSRAKAV